MIEQLDRIPPYDSEAEAGALGCTLNGAAAELNADLIEEAIRLLLSENPDAKERERLRGKFLFRQMRRLLA
jgi:hypothetical protein